MLMPGQISRDSLVRSQTQMSLSRYLDQTNGTTADDAVAYALAHNGELQAAGKEIEDSWQNFRWNAHAIITNLKDGQFAGFHAHLDLTPGKCVFHGIAEQVANDLG